MQLSKRTKISQVITVTAGAAGATAINGAVIDMQGYEGVTFIIQLGAIVAGAVTSAKVQQDTVVGMGSAADLAGTNITIADSDDEKTIYIDVLKPTERFLRLVVSRATQNATLSAIAIQYGARKQPTTHQATVIVGESHISPAEGTA